MTTAIADSITVNAHDVDTLTAAVAAFTGEPAEPGEVYRERGTFPLLPVASAGVVFHMHADGVYSTGQTRKVTTSCPSCGRRSGLVLGPSASFADLTSREAYRTMRSLALDPHPGLLGRIARRVFGCSKCDWKSVSVRRLRVNRGPVA